MLPKKIKFVKHLVRSEVFKKIEGHCRKYVSIHSEAATNLKLVWCSNVSWVFSEYRAYSAQWVRICFGARSLLELQIYSCSQILSFSAHQAVHSALGCGVCCAQCALVSLSHYASALAGLSFGEAPKKLLKCWGNSLPVPTSQWEKGENCHFRTLYAFLCWFYIFTNLPLLYNS